jgi:tetratricopeptide (TPR) repeat protein
MKNDFSSGAPGQPERRGASRVWPCYLLIGLLTLLVWGPTAGYEFVWDDQVLVVENPSIRSLGNIPRMFHSLEAQSAILTPSFRPLRTAWYALLEALGGKAGPRAWIFHLSNVLWHGTAAMLLFSVALLLFESVPGATAAGRRLGALLVGVGFALHPVNSEPVCWVKCLDDLMAGVFVLAATRRLLKWNGGRRDYLAALVCFILAMYGKESAVPFAAVVFFIAWGFRQMPWRKALGATAPFLAAALFYMLHRHVVMGRTSQYVPLSGSYGKTLLDMLAVVPQYLRLVLGIPPFCIDYNYMVYEPVHRFFSGAVLGGLFALLLAVGLALWLWPKPRSRLAAFGLIWAGLFLLPVSNIVPMMQYMADRFLYLPLPGFLIALAALALQLPRPGLSALGSALLAAIWCVASCNRMGIWHDDVTLFVRTSLEHPGITRVENNAVAAIFRLPWMEGLFPDYVKTGSIAMAGSLTPQQAQPVIKILTQARSLFADNQLVGSALAFAYAKTGQWSQAVALAQATASQHPDSANTWFNLAAILRASGNAAQARAACAKAIAVNPDYVQALHLQLSLCDELKDYPCALACARKLEKIEPENLEIRGRVRELRDKVETSNH